MIGTYEGLIGGPMESTPSVLDNYWYEPIGSGGNHTGIRVTPQGAMRVTTVMACVRVLAESIASLPLIVYERLPNGGKERVPDHYLYNVLHTQPNGWMTSFEFREMGAAHLALRGNFYALIIPGPTGSVEQLIPMHPDRITVSRLKNGRLIYEYQNPHTLKSDTYTQDEIFHVRGLSSDGIVGLCPIEMAAGALGLSIAAERHGQTFFGNGARPGMILESEQKVPHETRLQIRDDWERWHRGASNSHRTAVLDRGLKAHELGMTNEASQFLETRKYQDDEIARMFRVPPHMVGNLEKATFSNIEQQSIDFVQHTLRPWLVRWEQAITRDLIVDDKKYFAEFLIDGLLRGDVSSRFATYSIGIQNGIYSPNECRRFENLNPRDGGDEYLTPLNMSSTGQNEDEEETETEEQQESEDVQQRWIADIASRIQSIELNNAKNNAERNTPFSEWVKTFYGKHQARVTLMVQPLLESEDSAERLAAAICEHARAMIVALDGSPTGYLNYLSDQRTQDVSEIITTAINGKQK